MNKPLNSENVGKNIWSNLNFWLNNAGLIKTEPVFNHKFTNEISNPDDIGDYLPGILWCGLNKNEVVQWTWDYIHLWDSKYKTEIGLFGSVGNDGKLINRNSFLNNADALYGFISLYMLDKKDIYLKCAEDIVNALKNHGLSKKGFVFSSVGKNGSKFNFERGTISHIPVVSDYYAECCCKLYELTNNSDYLNLAKKMLDAWSNTKWFKQYGVCIDRVYPGGFIARSKNATITKGNTYFGLAALAYGRNTGDYSLLKTILSNIEKNYKRHDGNYGKIFNIKSKNLIDPKSEITYTKAVIDLYLDSSVALKDNSYYERALQISNFFNLSDNCLLAEASDKNFFFIDSQSDMFTLYCKFFSIDKNKLWKDKVYAILSGMNLFFDGKIYLNYIQDGKQLPEAAAKYQGLILKAVITAEKIFLENEKFYENPILDWVSVDR